MGLSGIHGDQKGELYSLELELQVVMRLDVSAGNSPLLLSKLLRHITSLVVFVLFLDGVS